MDVEDRQDVLNKYIERDFQNVIYIFFLLMVQPRRYWHKSAGASFYFLKINVFAFGQFVLARGFAWRARRYADVAFGAVVGGAGVGVLLHLAKEMPEQQRHGYAHQQPYQIDTAREDKYEFDDCHGVSVC